MDTSIVIEVSNYFTGHVRIIDNMLQTSKPDRGQHGYGVQSMRYVAGIYHGSLEFETINDIFFLTIRLPRS